MTTVKKFLREHRWFFILLGVMLLIRSAVVDWYVIPSGSMYPTLLIGDRVFANRLAYDVKFPFTDVILYRMRDPQRGDVVTFTSPNGIRLIKRLIAIPGDIVEMRDGDLIINGAKASYQLIYEPNPDHLEPDYQGPQFVYRETLGRRSSLIIVRPQDPSRIRSFGPLTIHRDEYLMLGDNRDNSRDSRYIGLIHRAYLTARVRYIMFSLDEQHHNRPRTSRFLAPI